MCFMLSTWVFLLIFLKKINNSKTLAALLLEIGRGAWEIPGQLGLLEPKFGSEPEEGCHLRAVLKKTGGNGTKFW